MYFTCIPIGKKLFMSYRGIFSLVKLGGGENSWNQINSILNPHIQAHRCRSYNWNCVLKRCEKYIASSQDIESGVTVPRFNYTSSCIRPHRQKNAENGKNPLII